MNIEPAADPPSGKLIYKIKDEKTASNDLKEFIQILNEQNFTLSNDNYKTKAIDFLKTYEWAIKDKQEFVRDSKENLAKLDWSIKMGKWLAEWIDSLWDLLENAENPELLIVSLIALGFIFKPFWKFALMAVVGDQALSALWLGWIPGSINKMTKESIDNVINSVIETYKLSWPDKSIPTPQSVIWLSRIMPKTAKDILDEIGTDWLGLDNTNKLKAVALKAINHEPDKKIDESQNNLFKADSRVTKTQMYLWLYSLLVAMWDWDAEKWFKNITDPNNNWKTLEKIARDFIDIKKWIIEQVIESAKKIFPGFTFSDYLKVSEDAPFYFGENYFSMKASDGRKYIIDSKKKPSGSWVYYFDSLPKKIMPDFAELDQNSIPNDVLESRKLAIELSGAGHYSKLTWVINKLTNNENKEAVVKWLVENMNGINIDKVVTAIGGVSKLNAWTDVAGSLNSSLQAVK